MWHLLDHVDLKCDLLFGRFLGACGCRCEQRLGNVVRREQPASVLVAGKGRGRKKIGLHATRFNLSTSCGLAHKDEVGERTSKRFLRLDVTSLGCASIIESCIVGNVGSCVFFGPLLFKSYAFRPSPTIKTTRLNGLIPCVTRRITGLCSRHTCDNFSRPLCSSSLVQL